MRLRRSASKKKLKSVASQRPSLLCRKSKRRLRKRKSARLNKQERPIWDAVMWTRTSWGSRSNHRSKMWWEWIRPRKLTHRHERLPLLPSSHSMWSKRLSRRTWASVLPSLSASLWTWSSGSWTEQKLRPSRRLPQLSHSSCSSINLAARSKLWSLAKRSSKVPESPLASQRAKTLCSRNLSRRI